MDRLMYYRDTIERVLIDRAGDPGAQGNIAREVIFDRSHDRYLLMKVGWRNDWRLHGCLIHIDIIDDKIWIQYDGTEDGVATDLEAAGIPKEHIVLAFHEPDARPYTGYAAA